jgi:hypothetical protein
MNRLHEAHLSDEKLIGFALDGEAYQRTHSTTLSTVQSASSA